MTDDASCSAADRTGYSRCQAIILAGGSGTRLWPLSRTQLPKQFLSLNGDATLLQQTISRVMHILPPQRIWIVTNEEHVFEVSKQVQDMDPDLSKQIISEPVGRNTLPAIVLGVDRIQEQDEQALVAVLPSDHLIHNQAKWGECMAKACGLAAQEWFVTFGITPTSPETGYGYIARGRDLGQGCCQVQRFIEKPDLSTAQSFLEQGGYFWNSGMFVFSLPAFLQALQDLQPDYWQWWQTRAEQPLTRSYSSLPSQSVDYGIMEKVDKQAVVPSDFGWDDLGNWEAVYRLGAKDSSGCVSRGDVLAQDCRDSLFFSQGGKLAVTGMDRTIVVQTRDATLVCPIDQVQSVKNLVTSLKQEGSHLVEAHVTVHRPWGSYTVLEEGRFHKIKRISLHPGAEMSIQMHHHRSEHWVIIQGTAKVRLKDQELFCAENQTVDIPQATVHQLTNPGKIPVEIIEIQSGSYLEEDDIVRFDQWPEPQA
jgi:mannose-1-phosphate guanylyltransferase/mannose-6-phosphate isomerase